VARIALAGGALSITSSRVSGIRAQSASSNPIENRIGTVIATDRNTIYVTYSGGPHTVKIVETTRIWKGELGSDPSVIRPGDEISVRGVRYGDGSLIASDVWLNIVALDGIIAKVNGLSVDVLPVRGQSVDQIKHIVLTDKTLTTNNNVVKREHIQPGRHAHVVGLALEDGTIQASRFTVYVGRRAVDSPPGLKYVDPATGKLIDK